MTKMFQELLSGFELQNDPPQDCLSFLNFHHQAEVAEHSRKVAAEAERLAVKFGIEPDKALTAGFLHDLGHVIPAANMITLAIDLGIEVLPAENTYPPLLHQKLSKVMAEVIFGVNDPEILAAVECHTTLRGKPSQLDLLLFIADKLQWEPGYGKPFLDAVLTGIEISLEQGAFAYINYVFGQRDKLKAMHPWLAAAYEYLNDFH